MESRYKKFLVKENISISSALKIITKSGKKGLVVIDSKQNFKGTLSDGDVRNAIINGKSLDESISEIYQKKPFYFYEKEIKNKDIKKIFIEKNFNFIPVVDKEKKLKKIIFWEDIFSFEKKSKFKKINSDVIIMAGGKGKRLKPLSDILPKPLIPLKGKPLIKHVIDNFLKFKKNKFFISINYKSSIIKTYFKDLKPKYKIDFISESKPLGTIGAVRKIKDKIQNNFILTNCDVLVDIDYADLEKYHCNKNNDITLVVTTKEFAMPYGNCEVDDNGKLITINEKPTYKFLINSGIYIINKKLIKLIPANQKYDIDKFINNAIKQNCKIGIYPITQDKWVDVGKWIDFYKASEYIT